MTEPDRKQTGMARPCKTDGNREQTRASSAAKDIDDARRARVHDNYTVKEGALLKSLVANLRLSHEDREKAAAAGAEYVRRVRNETSSSKMEAVLAEGEGALLAPAAVTAAIGAIRRDVHQVQPHALSLTQASEYGRVYRPGEMAELGGVDRKPQQGQEGSGLCAW